MPDNQRVDVDGRGEVNSVSEASRSPRFHLDEDSLLSRYLKGDEAALREVGERIGKYEPGF